MPNEYISLAERLKQVQQGRRQKFSQMMKPVFNRIEQIKQLKEKEEKEEQQLSAIKNIYGGDVEKYGLDLKEYDPKEFGTVSNYETYMRYEIDKAKPEYTSNLEESRKIAQIRRNIIDAYGEDALDEMDLNEESTYADWDREYKQYKYKTEQERDLTEDKREVTNKIIGNIGWEAAGKLNLQDRTLPQMRVLLAQTKYQKGQGEGEGVSVTGTGVKLSQPQKNKLVMITERYGVTPKKGEEAGLHKLFTLKYLEALDDISTSTRDNLSDISDENKLIIRKLTGREAGSLNKEESIRFITKELTKHIEGLPKGGMPGLTREENIVFGMQRKNAIGSGFESKKEKLEEQLDTTKIETGGWRNYE